MLQHLGALYGATAEVAALARIVKGGGIWNRIRLAAVELVLPVFKLTQRPWLPLSHASIQVHFARNLWRVDRGG